MVEKKSIDLLIDNGTVVTIDKDRRVIRHGAVAIKKNKIKEVGKARLLKAKYSAKRVYDAKNKLITPGLINSHLHFYHHMHRGLSPETLNGLGSVSYTHLTLPTIYSV